MPQALVSCSPSSHAYTGPHASLHSTMIIQHPSLFGCMASQHFVLSTHGAPPVQFPAHLNPGVSNSDPSFLIHPLSAFHPLTYRCPSISWLSCIGRRRPCASTTPCACSCRRPGSSSACCVLRGEVWGLARVPSEPRGLAAAKAGVCYPPACCGEMCVCLYVCWGKRCVCLCACWSKRCVCPRAC